MADNRLLRQDIPSSLGDALYQTGRNALLYPFRNPEAMAEFGLGMAPGSGEAMSARDAWNASGEAGNALMGGNYRDAAAQYGNMATGILGALPGAGIIARGTKRGAAWMDRNLPAGVNKLLDAATPSNMQDVAPAFPAWHGSPHDFDEFKLDKIGTGEGAQAYGHGLYFAENKGVAQYYKDALGGAKVGDVPFNDMDHSHQAAWAIADAGGDRAKASANLESVISKIDREYDGAYRQRMMRAKNLIDSGADVPKADLGRLYHTEIDAEPHQLLDWDKPLSEQGDSVKAALAKLGLNDDTLRPYPKLDSPVTGERILRQIQDARGIGPDEATKLLREAGIPGIRYLDQGSRGADGGTSNYVIFDDKLTKILSKE